MFGSDDFDDDTPEEGLSFSRTVAPKTRQFESAADAAGMTLNASPAVASVACASEMSVANSSSVTQREAEQNPKTGTVGDVKIDEGAVCILARRHRGSIVYSGEVDAAGLPSGEGRARWAMSNCSYKGKWLGGVPHGHGIWIDRCAEHAGDDGFVVYEGEFVAAMRHGSGKLVFKDGSATEGTFVAGQLEGWARLSEKDKRTWKRFAGGKIIEEATEEPERPSENSNTPELLRETVSALLEELGRVRQEVLTFADNLAQKAAAQQAQLSELVASSSENSVHNLRFDSSTMDVGKSLGSGSYGNVFFFTHRKTRGSYAGKVFFTQAAFEAEVDIFEKLQRGAGHKNVVRMLGTGHLSDGPVLVMPLYDGSLWDFLADRRSKNVGWFTQQQLAGFCMHILRGLTFLHRHGIAHRDLKTANVLVRTGRSGFSDLSAIVLTDFGVSTERSRATTFAGTLIAPEVLTTGGRGYDPYLADIFSFGAMLWEMLSAERLLSATLPLPALPSGFGSSYVGLKTMMHECTELDPSARLSISDLQEQCELLESAE